MPRGRLHRSDSSSSIETVDLSRVKWCQEATVIKAAPKDEEQDRHMLFEVQDVTIFPRQNHGSDGSGTQDTLEYPNVLEVRVKGPFSARGTLIVEDDEQKARVLMRKPKSIPIEVRTVHHFSIGETDTRRPCIWMLGRCGAWYEIVPSAAYKPTYDLMAEAVYLYYRIVDFYGSPQKRIKVQGKRDEITWLFFQYASTVGDGSTYEDVAERCEKHAMFLFYQFETDKDFINESTKRETPWHTTEIYKWLKKRRNDALTAVQRALKEPLCLTRDTPVRHQNAIAKAPSPLAPTSQVVHPKRERSLSSRASVESSSTSSNRSSDYSTSQDAGAALLKAPSAGVIASGKVPAHEQVSTRAGNQPVETPTQPLGGEDRVAVHTLIEAVKVAWSLTKSHPAKASSLVQVIYMKYKFPDMRATGSYKKAVEEVFHYYSKALVRDPAFEPFRGSHLHGWLLELAEKPFKHECLGPDKFPFLVVPRKKVERSSRDDYQSTGASGSHPTTGGKRLPPGRPRKSNLTVGSGRKRPHADIDGTSDEESGHKKSNYFSEDDTMDEATNAPDAYAEDEQTTVSYGEPVDFVVRTEPLPSWVTRRSDGAWVCDRNDCDYVVRGEAEDVARARIQKHIAEHAPVRCDRDGCDFAVLEDDEDVAQLRMEQHITALHGPWKCEREGCDFFARQENGATEQRRVREHIASHEKQDQKLTLAQSEGRPHLPIEYGTLATYLLQLLHAHPSLTSSTRTATQSPTPPNEPERDLEKLELAPTTRSRFRALLDGFKRSPRPVLDKIADLDVLQALARED